MPVTTSTPVGRRERKKQATRRALSEAAVRLFADRGFDATTVDDIAESVDVSARTFHRYFSTKEDAVFADADERAALFREALAARPADEPLLDGIRVAVHRLVADLLVEPELQRARARLMTSSPALRTRNLRTQEEWARLVAEHTARRTGEKPEDSWPSLVGACTVAVLATARWRWAADPSLDLATEYDRSLRLLTRFGVDDAQVATGAAT